MAATKPKRSTLSLTLWLLLFPALCSSNPQSRPFIPYRTSAFQEQDLDWQPDPHRSRVKQYNTISSTACPLQFSLGMSKRPHSSIGPAFAIRHPPVLQTVYPARPGKQVVYTTQYEHLDVLAAASMDTSKGGNNNDIKEVLTQMQEFPLLLESSSFHTSPILHDVNGDGIIDAIATDYDGGIYILGLGRATTERYFHHGQVPRLYIRRDWMEHRVREELNATATTTNNTEPYDPYHSYFEYSYGNKKDDAILRGVTVDSVDGPQTKALQSRRSRRVQHSSSSSSSDTVVNHRRLQEEIDVNGNVAVVQDEDTEGTNTETQETVSESLPEQHEEQASDTKQDGVDSVENSQDPVVSEPQTASDMNNENRERVIEETFTTGEEAQDDEVRYREMDAHQPMDDIIREDEDGIPTDDVAADYRRRYGDDVYAGGADDYAMDDPDYGRGAYRGEYDDYYNYNQKHEEYYDTSNYLRLPPHILCDPVLVEVPKLYGKENENEDVLILAVSYYLDEDEYQGFFSYKRFEDADLGDETEVKRGGYVGSALMSYVLGDSPRWSGQVHLDLSADFTAPENVTIVGELPTQADNTKMGAFALSPPTVADLNGDGQLDTLIGTSMGFVYVLNTRNVYKVDKWPIQMQRPVESRILVEDVTGDTNLEVFVTDIGGNVVCLTHAAEVVWHRNIPESLDVPGTDVDASSPMTLGDVDGDGVLDLVITVQIAETPFVFAFNAATGEDLAKFPIQLENRENDGGELHSKLPQPLLVDLHGDQSDILPYIRRNGTIWNRHKSVAFTKAPHGGSAGGLHIIQPIGDKLFITEAGSGCTNPVAIGDDIVATVQADDVHGTGRMDLVVATEEGKIVTLESASPWHPLNSWNHGEMRGRQNALAHGYSASQGIYVHDSSRHDSEIFGVYVTVTFEIFDNRPNIRNEPEKRKYKVEIRDGPSSSRVLFRSAYSETGVYSERFFIRYGPGWYSLSVVLMTTHGLLYEDTFTVRYNVSFLKGFDIMLWLPLVLASLAIFLCGAKKANWDDEDFDGGRDGQGLGILGRALP